MSAFQACDVLCFSKKGLTPFLQSMTAFQAWDGYAPSEME